MRQLLTWILELARLRLRPPSMWLRLASGSIFLPRSAGRENLTYYLERLIDDITRPRIARLGR